MHKALLTLVVLFSLLCLLALKKDIPAAPVSNNCFLVISDIHLEANCSELTADLNHSGNSGNELWKATQQQLIQVIQQRKPKFIVVLGDMPYHVYPALTDSVAQAMSFAGRVLQDLRTAANGIPLFLHLVIMILIRVIIINSLRSYLLKIKEGPIAGLPSIKAPV